MESNFKNPNIAGFLKRNHIAVLATADHQTAEPHAATIYYATDSQMNIFFLTKVKTKKSINLAGNPKAALAIYQAETQETLQITGPVTVVDNQTPIARLYAGEYILYKIWPQHIRLGEFKYGPEGQVFDNATPAEELLE
jgi:general stress protein 26